VSSNPHIIDPDTLRELSGKRSAAAVRNWAKKQGIPTLQGASGLFTTDAGLNHAMGIGAAGERSYRPEDIA